MLTGMSGLVPHSTSHYRRSSRCTRGPSWFQPPYAHGKDNSLPLGLAALETGTKLGFAFRFESGLTFVSATLKDHSDSTSAASVGSFFPQTQIFARPEKPLAGGLTQAMRQTSWRLETLANYRHNADCLYFYLTLVRTTAERGPWGKAWQRQDTKDWALWAVNGVSLLTYEFFCKTAPSDSLSMRPGEA